MYGQLDYVVKETEWITTNKLIIRSEEPSMEHRWAYVNPAIFQVGREDQMISDTAGWERCCLMLLALKTKKLWVKENSWCLDSGKKNTL